jgi:hypothetical protein
LLNILGRRTPFEWLFASVVLCVCPLFYTFHFDFGLSKKDLLRLAAVFFKIIIIIFQIECEMNLGSVCC